MMPSPQTESLPKPPPPPEEVRHAVLVARILTAALGARLLSLLLVLLDMVVAIGTLYDPTNQRLIAMGGVFIFSLAAFWRLERSVSKSN